MFVVLVTYFVIIPIVLRNNHMKNQIILLVMMMMLMDMETIPISLLMSNWRYKIHNTKDKISMSFHHICKESKHFLLKKDAKIK